MAADANVTIGADGSAFSSTLKALVKDTDTMANSMTARLARLGGAFGALKDMGGMIGGLAGSLVNMARAVVKPAAAAETLSLSFEVMLGNETETLEFMEKLNQYAATTPFALDEISAAAKVMLANTSLGAEEVMTRLRQIGNLSAMTGKSMRDIAQVYAKAMNVGVTNEVAESLETMGIPIRKTIAELQGISFEEVFDKISKRVLAAEHLNAALETLTTTGGKFDGATERLSQTFDGLASTLDDNVNMALRTFGEQLLPSITPVLQNMIRLVDEAMPHVERLGMVFGEWIGARVEDTVVPALDRLILQLPELGTQARWLMEDIQAMADKLLMIPNALEDLGNAFKRWSLIKVAEGVYSMGGDKAQRWADRVMKNNSTEQKRKNEIAALRQQRDEEWKAAEQRALARKAEAQARDEARAAERAAAAEQKQANDARLRQEMELAEARKAAAAEAKRHEEEHQRRLENYMDRRRRWKRNQEQKKFDELSIGDQGKALRQEARRNGVEGKVTPESIRARLDALAKEDAKNNEGKIAALERVLEAWDKLVDRKKAYAKQQADDRLTLRADAMEAAGNRRGAEKLREQMSVAARVEELKNAGADARTAKEQAMLEAKVAQAQQLQTQLQNSRVEFVQSHLAAQGGGGASLRIGGSQLEEAKRHTDLMREIRTALNKVKDKVTTGNGGGVAVLA